MLSIIIIIIYIFITYRVTAASNDLGEYGGGKCEAEGVARGPQGEPDHELGDGDPEQRGIWSLKMTEMCSWITLACHCTSHSCIQLHCILLKLGSHPPLLMTKDILIIRNAFDFHQ